MDVDRELDHIVSRNAFPFVFGVRQTGVGEVEGVIQLGLGEWRIGWIDHDCLTTYALHDALSMEFVALLLNMAEVGSLLLLICQTLLMRVKYNGFAISALILFF